MPVDLNNPITRMVLEASEIRELTGWSDPMIIDYQGILQDLIELINQINTIESSLQQSIKNNEQMIAVLNTDKWQASDAAIRRQQKKQEQLLYAW